MCELHVRNIVDHRLYVGVRIVLDRLHHVRVGVSPSPVADIDGLAQQIFVMLTLHPRIELLLVALAVRPVAVVAVLLVELGAQLEIGPRALAMTGWDRQAVQVHGDVRHVLGRNDVLVGEGVHLGVVAPPGPHVCELLDQDGRMLPGETGVEARLVPRGVGAVAALADDEGDLALLRVALGAQGHQLLALDLVPDIVGGLDARGIGLNRGDPGQARRARRLPVQQHAIKENCNDSKPIHFYTFLQRPAEDHRHRCDVLRNGTESPGPSNDWTRCASAIRSRLRARRYGNSAAAARHIPHSGRRSSGTAGAPAPFGYGSRHRPARRSSGLPCRNTISPVDDQRRIGHDPGRAPLAR